MNTQQIIDGWDKGVEPYVPKITSGMIGGGFWARCGGHYAGGYRTERGAINAVKRKFEARRLLNETRKRLPTA